MDLNDVWEQNKRWILGVVAGVLLFFIATSIVRSFYNGRSAESSARSVRNSLSNKELYDRRARKEARALGETLVATESMLQQELTFAPSEEFTLDGKGDPDLHFDATARAVRQRLVDKSQEYGVDMEPGNLEWVAPVGRVEIARTLAGLCVLEQAVSRLLEAGDQVRGTRPEAVGLVEIAKFEVSKTIGKGKAQSRRRRGRGRSRRNRRGGASAPADIEARLDEYEVSFKFSADAATTQLFLERCRAEQPTLLLQPGFKMKAGRDPNDPLLVQGRVVGISVKEGSSGS